MSALLPEPARAKLYALSTAADETDTLARAAAAALKGAETQAHRLITALQTSNEEQSKELRGRLEALETDVARMRETLRARQSRRDADRRLVVRLNEWLERIPRGVAIEAVEPPTLERGVTLDQLRAEVARLRGEMAAVSGAPLPLSELKARARAWVEERAERGRPMLAVNGSRLSINFRRASALVAGDLGTVMPTDTLVWLHRDAFAAALEKEVDALGIEGGLTDAERAARLDTLRVALLDAERREEAAIEVAGEQGSIIARRPDADPCALLNIKLVGAAARVAA